MNNRPFVGASNSALQFASWLRINHPKLFRQAAERADIAAEMRNGNFTRRGLGLVETEVVAEKSTGWFDTFLKVAGGLGATYLSLEAQKKQLQINIQRAQMGLDPIDVAGNPVITTEVVLDQNTVSKITQSAGLQVNKVLIFAGLAAVAAFFLLR